MNIFQKKVAEAVAAKASAKKQIDLITKQIDKLIDVDLKSAFEVGVYFETKTYEFKPIRHYTGAKTFKHSWYIKHKGENLSCGPKGCPVPKPVDYDKFFAELAVELKKKPK